MWFLTVSPPGAFLIHHWFWVAITCSNYKALIHLAQCENGLARFCDLIGGYLNMANQVWEYTFDLLNRSQPKYHCGTRIGNSAYDFDHLDDACWTKRTLFQSQTPCRFCPFNGHWWLNIRHSAIGFEHLMLNEWTIIHNSVELLASNVDESVITPLRKFLFLECMCKKLAAARGNPHRFTSRTDWNNM